MNVDKRLPGKGNSNSHGARPVHQIISMIRWIRTRRLSTMNYLRKAGEDEVTPEDAMFMARQFAPEI